MGRVIRPESENARNPYPDIVIKSRSARRIIKILSDDNAWLLSSLIQPLKHGGNKMIPGRILMIATILTLAFSVVAGLASGSSGRPPDRVSGQDHPKAVATNSEHKYTRSTGWVACGRIPYEGYDGRISQEGLAWNCS